VFQQHGRPDEHTQLLRKPFKSKDLAAALRETLDAQPRPAPQPVLAS
jgi:hypothetical protein